jgi:hypothetical protein
MHPTPHAARRPFCGTVMPRTTLVVISAKSDTRPAYVSVAAFATQCFCQIPVARHVAAYRSPPQTYHFTSQGVAMMPMFPRRYGAVPVCTGAIPLHQPLPVNFAVTAIVLTHHRLCAVAYMVWIISAFRRDGSCHSF